MLMPEETEQNRENADFGRTEEDWTDQDNEPDTVRFSGNPGIQCAVDDATSPVDFIKTIFVDEHVSEQHVEQTNLYAQQVTAMTVGATPGSVLSLWKADTLTEMKVFHALTVNTGLFWKPETKQYWSTDPLLETPVFGKYMARGRYLAILTFFYVVDNETR